MSAPHHHKLIIYQLLVRHFGNTNTKNKYFGSLSENGSGKFNQISDKALQSIREFGATHIWYTGILEHATMTDYSLFGIAQDHPMIVKGKAGSPYAVKDYYDVDPDLAENVTMRMEEFEALLHRTRSQKLKSIIDFIPNHVARQYRSDKRPEGVSDFGEQDQTDLAFSPDNNFYYVPNEPFQVPEGLSTPLKVKHKYVEFPAKATGNDVFRADPTVYDWYETVKLNYGVDYLDNRKTHFDPIPDTWLKMRDILLFWARKGVDGFRCDMAEMVPVEFWGWVIPLVKNENPELIFIAEIYNPNEYRRYLSDGKFDYLYDKVGLYDTMRRLVEGSGNADDITRLWQQETGEIAPNMLRFLENHDEQRIASRYFAGNPFSALPAMALSATLHTGPVMIYSGQELGIAANDAEGYQGDDGRTSIFDYWGIPELQAWIRGGKFNENNLSDKQRVLRKFYADLNHLIVANEAFHSGAFYDLQYVNFHGQSAGYDSARIFSFLRYTSRQKVLAVFNFDHQSEFITHVRIPEPVWVETLGLDTDRTYELAGIFGNPAGDINFRFDESPGGVPVSLPPGAFRFWQIMG